MKKLLSVLLVAAMVLGLAGTAFAASSVVAGAKFSDIAGNDAEGDITLLAVRNILKGDSGATTVRPDATITRAEFAAMVVRMLGKESLATSLASMKPATKDEIPSWAWGYVNVVSSMGIMKGDPDGAFRPLDNVTFAEALAMLERAIGWDIKATGLWPTNYLMVAYELELNDGVDVFANTPATRGEVAIMMVNTMNTQKLLGISEDGDDNLAASILGTNTVEGLVSAVDAANNDIDINYNSDADADIEVNDHDLATSVSLVGAKTFADLLNVNVKAILNSDDEIVFVEVVDDANVVVGTLDTFEINDDGDDVIVLNSGDEYVIAATANVKINTLPLTYAVAVTFDVDDEYTGLIDADASVVLNLVDDEVVFIDATQVTYEDTVADDEATVDADDEDLYYLDTVAIDNLEVDVTTPVTIDGSAKKVTDLDADDVVYVTNDWIADTDAVTAGDQPGAGIEVLSIEAFRATVAGEVTRVRTAADGDITVTIKLADGTTKGYVLTTVEQRVPAIGSKVEYRLNKDGEARFEVQASAAASVVYAVDKYTENTGSTKYFVVLDIAGVEQTFETDALTYADVLAAGDSSLGQYTLDAGVLDSWTPETLTLEDYEVVSVDTANNVVVLLGDADGVGGLNDYVAFGTTTDGLSVYQVTDTNEYEYVGVAALKAGDTVQVSDGVLYLIVVPE